jgi:hypothetical protein
MHMHTFGSLASYLNSPLHALCMLRCMPDQILLTHMHAQHLA